MSLSTVFSVVMFRVTIAVSAMILAAPIAWASPDIDINLGYSQVVRPVDLPGTVIVGDDAIADATIGGGNTVILTGKALGATNLIILDAAGNEILSVAVVVAPVDRRARSMIRVLKGGTDEQNYMCGPEPGCSAVEGGSSLAMPTGEKPRRAGQAPEEGDTGQPNP